MPNRTLIKQAVQLLKEGQLVAFPTETVYGLGADASNEEALKKLFQTKGRPENHPVIVHIASQEQLAHWAEPCRDAFLLARRFWPGPLTLILPKAPHVSPLVTGGQNSIGIRVPRHAVALELLEAFAGGIAAPSANKFGRLSPTSKDAVEENFGSELGLVLDGGNCQVGIESTILSLLEPEQPVILRPGMVHKEALEEVLGKSVAMAAPGRSNTIGSVVKEAIVGEPEAELRAPGTLLSHYAPLTPLLVVAEEAVSEQLNALIAEGKTVGLLARVNSRLSHLAGPKLVHRLIEAEPDGYAANLYQVLRDLDKLGLDFILVVAPPAEKHWEGICDRLSRAGFAESRKRQLQT